MFSEEEQKTGVGGITVQDMWVGLQLLDKAASTGVIQPVEYSVLAAWRSNLTTAIQRAVGKNYDEETVKLRQAQMEAQQQSQHQAPQAALQE